MDGCLDVGRLSSNLEKTLVITKKLQTRNRWRKGAWDFTYKRTGLIYSEKATSVDKSPFFWHCLKVNYFWNMSTFFQKRMKTVRQVKIGWFWIAFLVPSISSKKQTKISLMNSFICFLEETSAWENHFNFLAFQ